MTSKLYTVWWNMKRRCDDPKSRGYKYYGGRGITYDQSWKTYEGFASDMRPGWQPDLRLDRRDNDSHYCKENCRWVSVEESHQNRRRFGNNTSGISGVGKLRGNEFRARVGKGGKVILYQGPDFFEACCARKSWEAKWLKRASV